MRESRKKIAAVALVLAGILAAGCTKNDEGEGGNIDITPVPTQTAEASPTPLPDANIPLSPMETWCESMMVKPDQEWTREEAKKFSRQCLYNE